MDAAFASAVASVLQSGGGEPRWTAAVFGAAEAFVYIAGPDRFGDQTGSLVSHALARGGPPTAKAVGRTAVDIATARAFALALQVTLGQPLGAEQLRAEMLVRSLAPGLWLDLARDQLTAASLLRTVARGLRERRMAPADIVVRLPGIVARQGAASARSVVDLACRILRSQGRREDAEDLVDRAGRVLGQGRDAVWGGTFGEGAVAHPDPA